MDFAIKGLNYRTSRKLGAREQFHVARRLSPVLLALAEAGEKVTFNGAVPQLDGADELAAMKPLVLAISTMPDAEADFVLTTCLAVVQFNQHPEGSGAVLWANVQAPGGALMFPEQIDLAAMIQMVVAVVRENLSNFFDAPSASTSDVPKGSAA